MAGRVEGKVALVTGGASGIGRGCAEALAREGASVIISDVQDDKGPGVVSEIVAAGGKAEYLHHDVTDEDAWIEVMAEIDRKHGRLDVLVNNAGIGMRAVSPRFITEPQPFWTVPPEGFRDVAAASLSGCFLTARAVVPRMLAAGAGRVVNISMNHPTMNRKGFVPYGPARAGAGALSRIMAADLAGSPVTVNLLLPGGATLTAMIPGDLPGQMRSRLLPASVMAEPIRWLCSPAAAGVHDQRIVASEFASWLTQRAGHGRT